MNPRPTITTALLALCSAAAHANGPDPRLREVVYDAHAVVTVPVKRGIVSLIALDPDETITDVAAGLGGDCAKPDSAWCIAAQPGGRNLFVKAKSNADAANNLVVVTDRRTHTFQFIVLPDGDPRAPVYRLTVKAPAPPPPVQPRPRVAAPTPEPPRERIKQPSQASAADIVAGRLQAGPNVLNTDYSIAEGEHSQDIVPSLVFDDGRFTYFRFPGNREVPAVFHVLGDGGETLVNARMEDDLLVVDRVSRRLMLRAGAAVVGVWNDAFDIDGVPPTGGTTVSGVQRTLRFGPAQVTNSGELVR